MKPNGAWTEKEQQFHQHSEYLAKYMIETLPKDRPVYDFGCGTGYYVRRLRGEGFCAVGFDGYVPEGAPDWMIEKDLTEDYAGFVNDRGCKINRGSVISLEVGEHLPKTAQENFMRTVTEHCDGRLIFSWAEIGQPGIGHINCRDQKEVIEDVVSRGFVYLKDETMKCREQIEDNVDWFRRTLLIFERA